jgi:hypothetical protein
MYIYVNEKAKSHGSNPFWHKKRKYERTTYLKTVGWDFSPLFPLVYKISRKNIFCKLT